MLLLHDIRAIKGRRESWRRGIYLFLENLYPWRPGCSFYCARHRHNLQLISIIKVSLPFMGLAGVSRSEVSFFRLPRFSARVSVFQTTTTTITTPPSLPPLVVSLLGLIFAKTSQFLIPRDYSSSIEPLPINRPNFPLHPPLPPPV